MESTKTLFDALCFFNDYVFTRTSDIIKYGGKRTLFYHSACIRTCFNHCKIKTFSSSIDGERSKCSAEEAIMSVINGITGTVELWHWFLKQISAKLNENYSYKQVH